MISQELPPSRVLHAISSTPWAILPEKLEQIVEVAELHAKGIKLSAEEIEARMGPPRRAGGESSGGVIAVLPLYGTIMPRANLVTQYSGGTSAEAFGRGFDKALADPDVRAIVLDVDSPGGSVSGIEELARKIYRGRGKKRIIAVANYTMASAAYYVASAADEVVASPSAEVGSIGVFTVHADVSGADAKAGIKRTIIKAGRHKAEGNPYEPLGEEAHAAIQGEVNEFYDLFVGAVARHRGVSRDVVEAKFGGGRVLTAQRARAAGMVNRVATLEEVLDELTGKSPARQRGGSSAGLAAEAVTVDQERQPRPPFAFGLARRQASEWTKAEAHRVAAHEAAHVVVLAAVGASVSRAWINFSMDTSGSLQLDGGGCKYDENDAAAEGLIAGLMAGFAGESILTGWTDYVSFSLGSDRDYALAAMQAERAGLDEATAIQAGISDARSLLVRHRSAGQAVKRALIEDGSLEAPQLAAILQAHGLG